MGMTILNARQRLHEKWMELTKDGTDKKTMQALSIAETVLGYYDDSLKADMVAMLTEIQLEFEEIEVVKENTEIRVGECCMKGACIDLIQQKINSLKAESEDNNAE